MTIYYLMIAVWLFYAAYLYQTPLIYNNLLRSFEAFIPFVSLFLIAGLRGVSVGTDTAVYAYEFTNIDYNNMRATEFGYSYLNLFISNIGGDFRFFLLAASFITTFSITLLIHNYSKNIIFSYILYVCLGMFAFSMSGLRQSIAISFTILAFIALLKNRKIVFISLVLLATSFHNSSILFLSLLVFIGRKFTQNQAMMVFIFFFISPFFLVNFLEVIEQLLNLKYLNEYSNDATSANPLVTAIAVLIPFFSLFFWPSKNTQLFSTFFIMSCISMSIHLIANDFQMIGRLALFFNLYSIILLPNIVDMIRPSSFQWAAKSVLFLLVLFQFAITMPGNSIGIDNYTFLNF